jgi:glycerol-3-phosphate acyltransferase PlsY
MNSLTSGLILTVAAYLVGSLPFGYLAGKLVAGVDIRTQGSRNIGATNVARVLGKKLGLLVLVLDCLKGLLPVWLLANLHAVLAGIPGETEHIRIACGVATIVGHMFPCWLGFRGGKGVATSLGVVLVLSWQATLVTAGVFIVVFAVSRIASLSSMLAAVGFAVAHLCLQPEPFLPQNWSLTAFALGVPVLILLRHRSNIGRLLRREEQPFNAPNSGKRSSKY